MKVSIFTVSIDNQTDGVRKVINWRNSSDRKWLTNHLHWAMHNNHEVSIAPESN